MTLAPFCSANRFPNPASHALAVMTAQTDRLILARWLGRSRGKTASITRRIDAAVKRSAPDQGKVEVDRSIGYVQPEATPLAKTLPVLDFAPRRFPTRAFARPHHRPKVRQEVEPRESAPVPSALFADSTRPLEPRLAPLRGIPAFIGHPPICRLLVKMLWRVGGPWNETLGCPQNA